LRFFLAVATIPYRNARELRIFDPNVHGFRISSL
jgi:hypothetical protein